MKLLLTNEERLARLRARWKRQQEERKKERVAIPRETVGVSEVRVSRQEKLITPAMMRMAERYFWGRRGVQVEWQSWGVREA